MMKTVKVLWGATELGAPHFSSDVLWRTGFRAPDPFFLVESGKENFLLVSPLEFGRARKEAAADHIRLLGAGGGSAGLVQFLRRSGVREVAVPHAFPHGIARELAGHFSVTVLGARVFPERIRKSAAEILAIREAAAATERAVIAAVKFLEACRIRAGKIWFEKEAVTSERVRGILEDALWHEGYAASGTIVASGSQAAHPHAIGRGALQARSPIVMDVFPVSRATHYWADMTRTFFKGEPTAATARMYETVRVAQKRAIAAVRAGADGKAIHRIASSYMSAQGYPTDTKGAQPRGFIHGLGHGVGMDIHEAPHIGSRSEILQQGSVITIEPGLYYPRPVAHRGRMIPAGGVRIEDMAVVRKDGCELLTHVPKDLADVILPA